MGDALQPVATDGICGGNESQKLFVEGAEVGGWLDEGFGEGAGGEPVGEGLSGCGKTFEVGEVELGDACQQRRGYRWNQERVAGWVERDLQIGKNATGSDFGEDGFHG